MNRRRLGTAVLIWGLLQILFGVFYLLRADNAPGAKPDPFAVQRSYNQVKRDLHKAFPVGASIALSGLLICMLGSRIQKSADSPAGQSSLEES